MNWFAVLLFIFNAKTQKGNLLQDKKIIILPKKKKKNFLIRTSYNLQQGYVQRHLLWVYIDNVIVILNEW